MGQAPSWRPDLFPARGWVRRRHVPLRKGSFMPTAEASDPPIGVRDLLRPSGPPILRRGPEPQRVPEEAGSPNSRGSGPPRKSQTPHGSQATVGTL